MHYVVRWPESINDSVQSFPYVNIWFTYLHIIYDIYTVYTLFLQEQRVYLIALVNTSVKRTRSKNTSQ